jgi:hypothetical protein
MTLPPTTTLSKAITVPELVAIYRRAETDIRDAFALLAGAERRLSEAFALAESTRAISVCQHHYRSMDWTDVDGALEGVRREVWAAIVDRLELRRMMSVARAKELDEQLRKGELPEITEDSVSAFARRYLDALPAMLSEAVGEVFEWLRPPGSKYRRNSELEVPKRVILRWVAEWWGSYWYVHDSKQAMLTALENVFTALDGRGQITRTHRSELGNAIHRAGRDGAFETAYFKGRVCKNRNLHLEFLRADLLARLNQIAGGRRLRPAAED